MLTEIILQKTGVIMTVTEVW